MASKVLKSAALWFLAKFYRCLAWTWRVYHVDHPDGHPRSVPSPRIYAHFHGDELVLVGMYRDLPMAVLSSRSKDGEYMKEFLNRLGYTVARGSSSRGGAGGLKGLIDRVNGSTPREPLSASLAVDGPRGPRYRVKEGILKLAQETTGEIVPGASAASFRYVFKKAWNRCYLPLFFSRCVVVYGKPIPVPKDLTPEGWEDLRLQVEKKLLCLKGEAVGWIHTRSWRGKRFSKLKSQEVVGV